MMYSNRHNKIVKQFGFSLWELSLVMLIIVGLFVALITVMPYLVQHKEIKTNTKSLFTVDEHLLGFIATHARMPCPDTNNDGLENCTASQGSLPYRTLGLNKDYVSTGNVVMKYAVYRNALNDADLTVLANHFNPTDSHGLVAATNNLNGLDFCQSLINAQNSTFSENYAHIVLEDGTFHPVPYVIVTAGLTDSDGTSGVFDGRNATTKMDFEAPSKAHNYQYDDSVKTRNFTELAQTLNCDVAMNSLNLLANAKSTHTNNVNLLGNVKNQVESGIFVHSAKIALSVVLTAVAANTLASAITTLSAASVFLAESIGACIASLGITCAAIAAAVTAIVLSAIGIVAAGTAVGANAVAIAPLAIGLSKLVNLKAEVATAVNLDDSSTDYASLLEYLQERTRDLMQQAPIKVRLVRDKINESLSHVRSLKGKFINLLRIINRIDALIGNSSAYMDDILSVRTQIQLTLTKLDIIQSSLQSAGVDVNNAVTAMGAAVVTGTPPNQITTYPNFDYEVVKAQLQVAKTKLDPTIAALEVFKNIYPTIRPPIHALANNLSLGSSQKEFTAYLLLDLTLSLTLDELYPHSNQFVIDVDVSKETGALEGSKGAIVDAIETIKSALDSENRAAELENSIITGNPNATEGQFSVISGVDAILNAVDEKGVEQ